MKMKKALAKVKKVAKVVKGAAKANPSKVRRGIAKKVSAKMKSC